MEQPVQVVQPSGGGGFQPRCRPAHPDYGLGPPALHAQGVEVAVPESGQAGGVGRKSEPGRSGGRFPVAGGELPVAAGRLRSGYLLGQDGGDEDFDQPARRGQPHSPAQPSRPPHRRMPRRQSRRVVELPHPLRYTLKRLCGALPPGVDRQLAAPEPHPRRNRPRSGAGGPPQPVLADLEGRALQTIHHQGGAQIKRTGEGKHTRPGPHQRSRATRHPLKVPPPCGTTRAAADELLPRVWPPGLPRSSLGLHRDISRGVAASRVLSAL